MAPKKKTAAKKPAKRGAAPAKAAAKGKPSGGARAAGRGAQGEVVYSDVLHELRTSLVSRLIR
jgi:hypothetical protein